ncbi:hypothetical protein [Halalkalibacter hemicellulosilyticus]|uniref:Uncharacterized protein n=1 Tax=Halalkalibacter hemicellulosilyticusJCM 9152 TaxID=1236971 RepID=W4QG36_9BACI|nr:hypothetical protein [Halalkalibacter hemicellulosilyticus]GAE30613.1 hypothetical protein JCM9152_2025 [Halalkalibacter hemicellulosilyticusJCM 9152]
MNYSSDSRGTIFFPIFGRFNASPQSIKNSHDTYDVYLEEDYIGKKELLTENDTIEDVLKFIESQGISDVEAHLKGDHYIIEAHTKDLERVKAVIETYLQNR